MEISKSDLVLSVAGHDKGMLFYVISSDGVYVTIVNGKERTLERPKRKKLKHVRKLPRPDSLLTEKIRSGKPLLNSELRRELAAIRQEINVSTKEGS
mgnify:CR=1 FL=1